MSKECKDLRLFKTFEAIAHLINRFQNIRLSIVAERCFHDFFKSLVDLNKYKRKISSLHLYTFNVPLINPSTLRAFVENDII